LLKSQSPDIFLRSVIFSLNVEVEEGIILLYRDDYFARTNSMVIMLTLILERLYLGIGGTVDIIPHCLEADLQFLL
jgi:hypothetical protein